MSNGMLRLVGAPARYLRYLRAARVLQAGLPDREDLERTLDFVFQFEHNQITIAPVQIRSECLRFGEIVQELRPQSVVEIGTWNGGTLFLLASLATDDAILISVDASSGACRRALLRAMARGNQQVVPFRTYSDDSRILQRVKTTLGARTLDLLFIDGGHDYETVSGDFRRFGPLVRPGGLVAFHDIVPSRGSGDVPKFWAEIRDSYDSEEIIDNPEDSMGIGVLRIGGTPKVG